MKPIKQWMSFILTNGVFALGLYLAFVKFQNKTAFVSSVVSICWIWAIIQWPIAILLMIGSLIAKAKTPVPEKLVFHVPTTVSVCFDFIIIGFMAYFGYFWLSIAWFSHIIAQIFIRVIMEDINKTERGER